ncbi:MAG: phosphotransferase [Erysipelotrichia bacterium]|nr:phosphotransferase [Erysipelotrichia bacterium]
MLDTIIQNLFHTKQYTLSKTDKGLTNHNYLLCVQGKQYMVRIPRADSGHIINRKHEKTVSTLAACLDVETLYFDVNSGIKITLYHDDVYTYEQCPFPDKIERCAKLMKRLHTLDKVDFHFEPFATLTNYRSHVHTPLFDLSAYDKDIEQVKHFNNPEVLCHNDWVDGNILFSEHKDYLIDYEYGANNDPLFDVISFLSENQIFDQTLRERFYAVYFDHLSEETRKQLYLWEIFQNVLWCNWAMMMYESRKEKIYKEIANDKYNALLSMK